MLKKDELTIYLTSKCNLSCKHCYRPPSSSVLTLDDLQWILENIQNKRTTFLGGEPFLYPYLRECIDVFPQITISTNGTYINENNIGWLKKINGLQLSVEMGHEETDYIRGKGVWDKLMDAKKLLEKENIEYYFRASFYELNLNGLKYFHELEVPLVLFPRIGKPPLNEKLTAMLFEEVMKHDNWILALPNFMRYLNKNGRCKAGTERLNVLYDKKITPCNFDLDYHLGKIGDDIESIEENINFYLRQNGSIPVECAGCKHAEECRGSCYAVNASKGCPLKYDFNISSFAEKYNVSPQDIKHQADMTVKFMKKMLVC
jgi:radical SAM protein with 4Fe4S-binding SPASM domain